MASVSAKMPPDTSLKVANPGESQYSARMSSAPNPLPSITTFPHPDIFRALGTDGIRDLLRAVYRHIGESSIAGLFPKGDALMDAADKSSLFFVGICGGPPLYEQKYGAPRMRQRHAPFAITNEARLVWLSCWERVLETAPQDLGFPAEHIADFRTYLTTFSLWMVNS